MGRRSGLLLDRILVIDLEATCWPTRAARPADERQEIIEIGAVLLDEQGALHRQESILVRPTRSHVNAFCTELTGHTQERLERDGVTFAQACQRLERRFESPRRVLASWGAFDRRLFERQCRELDVPYPCGSTHLDIKTLHALLRHLGKPLGLLGALTHESMVFEGRPHSGVDDACNAARILAILTGRVENSPTPSP